MRVLLLALTLLALLSTVSAPLALAQDHSQHQHQQSTDNDPFNEQDVQYVCPMHSQIVKDEPGTCPICGMDLVQKKTEVRPQSQQPSNDMSERSESDTDRSRDFMVPVKQQQALRVTTAVVERKNVTPSISAQAQVSWQQSAKYHVHARAQGWIEELYADIEGQWVDKGDKLYRVYAPDLVVAQDDYLQLLNSLAEVGNSQRQQQFKQRGQQRLRLLGMTEAQIAQLEKSGETRYEVDYFAPKSGYVTELNIQQGMYVNPGLELMTISGDEQLWFMLDVPVRYADQLAVGQMVHLSSEQIDGHWMNRIDYLYPQVDQSTQTITARVPVDASIDNLREGIWASGRIQLDTIENALVIPVKSLIQTQKNNRVIVQTNEQAFAVRKVTTGLRIGDDIVIREGLQEGERVVTNGQFLLDSEASLRGLQPDAEARPAMQHDHGGH